MNLGLELEAHPHPPDHIRLTVRTVTPHGKRVALRQECLTILEEDVEENDADLVKDGHGGVQQDGHDGSHWIFDLLSFSI